MEGSTRDGRATQRAATHSHMQGKNMAMIPEDGPTFFDPDTNIELNRIPITRGHIRDGAEAMTARKYWRLGVPQHRIAAMLGVHPLDVHNLLGDKPRRPGTGHLHDGHGDPDQDALPI
jgi:hypothetical protein